ncbi:MAG: signal peptide peptidase SppA [bacterium]|nr:signal peptide peptidase SppA [bacterium]
MFKDSLSKIGAALALFFAIMLVLEALTLMVWVVPDISKARKIAVLDVEGTILDAGPIISQLHKYKDDPSIAGIVIRINSPGGMAAAAQEIYQEIKKVRQEGKRVFASIESLGASGGYYIACGAETIFANPSTITGSIGVILPTSNYQELMNKLGIKFGAIKSGAYKDIGSPFKDMTAEEKVILQEFVDDVQAQFIEAVAEGRKMEKSEVKKVADGRIFTGRQALSLGLVDRLGNLNDAISWTAKRVGIEGKPQIVREKKTFPFLELFSEAMSKFIPPKTAGMMYYWGG